MMTINVFQYKLTHSSVCFQDKTLYASSLEYLKEYCGTFNINDSEQRLATFEEFNQGSVKTKVRLYLDKAENHS